LKIGGKVNVAHQESKCKAWKQQIADYEAEISISTPYDRMDEEMARFYPNVVGNGHPDVCLCPACAPGEYADYGDQETAYVPPTFLTLREALKEAQKEAEHLHGAAPGAIYWDEHRGNYSRVWYDEKPHGAKRPWYYLADSSSPLENRPLYVLEDSQLETLVVFAEARSWESMPHVVG
jgi:hypothetical protein